jgi:hypothetical protein
MSDIEDKVAREAMSEWSRGDAAGDIDGQTERSKWAGAHKSMWATSEFQNFRSGELLNFNSTFSRFLLFSALSCSSHISPPLTVETAIASECDIIAISHATRLSSQEKQSRLNSEVFASREAGFSNRE